MSDIITRNNVKLLDRGTQPMLFAHGSGCDQNMWRFVTPAFEKDLHPGAAERVTGGVRGG